MAYRITGKDKRVNRRIWLYILDRYPFNLRLLLTTKMLLKAIAPAASMGFNNPAAAAGIKMTL